jgi:large subunit ribosomal protein L13
MLGVQKTVQATNQDRNPEWLLVDASQYVLGRMATRIARILMGKHKPIYTPHVDMGDFVVVLNAAKVQVTGKKQRNKIYQRYTGWVGGRKEETMASLLERKPEEVIKLAVKRMLPKTKLGRAMLDKLKIYRGTEHKHQGQNPQPYEL